MPEMIIIGPSISLCHHSKMGCFSIFMWRRVDRNVLARLKTVHYWKSDTDWIYLVGPADQDFFTTFHLQPLYVV